MRASGKLLGDDGVEPLSLAMDSGCGTQPSVAMSGARWRRRFARLPEGKVRSMRSARAPSEVGGHALGRPRARVAAPLLLAASFALVSACNHPDHAMKSRANPPTDQAGDAGSPGSHASASAGQAPIELLAFTDGLRAGHVRQTPLLEKVATIPAREHGMPPTRAASRVYGDGAYYLAQVSHDDVSPHWAYLSSLRPDGMARLQALLAEACGTSARVQSDDTGSVSYVSNA